MLEDLEKQTPESPSRFEGNVWLMETKLVSASEAMRPVEDKLLAAGWSDDDVWLFPVVVQEAIANAIIHGNMGLRHEEGEDKALFEARIARAENDPATTEKKVRVEFNITKDDATVTVLDSGLGFSPTEVPDPTSAERLYEPSGRGVDLMSKICDKVEFYPGKTVLYFRKGEKKIDLD